MTDVIGRVVVVAALAVSACCLVGCGDGSAESASVLTEPTATTPVMETTAPAPSGPVEASSLVCADREHTSSVWDHFDGRGTPTEELPVQLARLQRVELADRWPDALLAVAYQDDNRLDAVGRTESGDPIAVFTFAKVDGHDEWQLELGTVC
jgi:hypothetical protein